jgi:hypothetical protein
MDSANDRTYRTQGGPYPLNFHEDEHVLRHFLASYFLSLTRLLIRVPIAL